MNTDSTTYSSSAYQAFFSIDPGEYKEKIRFMDRYRSALDTLTLDEYVEIMDAYAEALFETGRYQKHLDVADQLIELVIRNNISSVGEKDLYFETLFQKAASLYNLERTDEAIHILQELLKMDPHHESTRLFLVNCHVRKHRPQLRRIRSISIVSILLSAIVIVFELFIVRPMLDSWTPFVELARNSMFISGTVFLICGELWVRYRAVSRMYRFAQKGKTKNEV